MRRPSTSTLAAGLAILVALGAAAGVAWRLSDPAVAWLDGEGPAHWIVYPSPGTVQPRAIASLDATFSRSFHLDAPPETATLRFRGFRSVAVRVNGREVGAAGGPAWKEVRGVPVAALLRAGENAIEARVSNDAGPPALWLALELPGGTIASDERWTSSWAGAAPRAAIRATAPKPGRMHDPDGLVPSSLAALALEWPRLAGLWAIAALGAAGAALVAWRRPGGRLGSPNSAWPVGLAVGGVALLWTVLFVNNSPWLPLSEGFDWLPHVEYAQFVQERHAIPFADDGWQMFQPPLYYLLLAACCSALGVPATDPQAAAAVRALGLGIGVAHLALLGACLRLVLPGRPRAQVAGVVIGGFLPCMLYLHEYPANEPLVAMLSTAALLVAIRLLRRDDPRLLEHAALGLVLGLALLAKVSALLVVLPVLGALGARALLGDRARRARRAAGTAVAAVTMAATAGWYYAAVWRRFGTPLVGGWDARRGMGWWADPGYRTLDDFLRFGRAFASPLFAGFDGVWDGLWVTLWGDGLLSGRIDAALVGPWWSPALMSAALLLAVVPAAAVLAGGASALVRWLRDPDAVTGMLVGLAALVLLAVAWMAVAVPAVAATKASYGLLALVPFCAFAAHALSSVAGRRRAGILVASALGAWALTSYSAYLVDGASGKARLYRGMADAQRGDIAGALPLLWEAVARDPEDWSARVVLADQLLQAGGTRSEIERLLAPEATVPGRALRHVALAALAFREGDAGGVERALGRALEEDPDCLNAHLQLAALAERSGDVERAVRFLREALRVDPQHRAAHAALSTLYARLGDRAAAAKHATYAGRLGGG